MKVIGIGNAITDVICKVTDEFLEKNLLKKGTMKLIDKDEFFKLLSYLNIEETISGGSVANSIVALSQLGNDVGFIGKINDDELGGKYETGLKKENVKFFCKKKIEKIKTGTCLILITPDYERTMCAYLGIAGKIDETDINESLITKSQITFLEGYLLDKGGPKKAFEKAIKFSNITAISLSDEFCVERHKNYFLDLVKNKIDIVFGNEKEFLSLINAKSFDEVINFSKILNKEIIITRGKGGAITIFDSKIFKCNAKENLKIKDLTGAGDLFAAGYLHHKINGGSIQERLEKGTELSSEIIQKIGARL
jgi:fructokinase